MRIVGDKFVIQLNSLSRMLLLSAFGTCKFTLLHISHPLADAVYENDLVDEKKLEELFQRFKNAAEGDMLELTLDEEILIYTALDVTCKSFLTNIADDLHSKSQDFINATEANFSDVRSTLLKGCQFVMEGMRSTLKDIPKFMERVRFLDTQLYVE